MKTSHLARPSRRFADRTRTRRRQRPLGHLERLESRQLLSGSPWQNPINYMDVNSDEAVTPLDALVVINALNKYGPQPLANVVILPLDAPLDPPEGTTLVPTGGYIDTNGDEYLSPIDALRVVNGLNGQPPEVRIRLVAVDLVGNDITQVQQGDDFRLEARVQDLRGTVPAGVFAAYLDVLYNPAITSIDVPNEFDHGPDYPNGLVGNFATPGLIDEAGAFDGLTPLGPDELLLWTVRIHADAVGQQDFIADPADVQPDHAVLVFGQNFPVPINLIDYVSDSIAVVSPNLPGLSIDDVALPEGNSGTTDFTFTVTLSAASAATVTVNFATANGSAVEPGDYAAQAGVLTFAPGVVSRTIAVPVNGDTAPEGNENFTVNLSGAVGANIADAQGTGTILDDDGAPTVAVSDASVVEGDVGTTNMVFTVTVTGNVTVPVQVGFATADNTAIAGTDYLSQSGNLTFNPGDPQSKTVTVPVRGDFIDEPDEIFFLNLSSAINATIVDAQGIGTIIDNDAAPAMTIADITVTEGNAGTTPATFTVGLSSASAKTITVAYATADGTAVAPGDYTTTTGTLTFLPGSTTAQVVVPVIGDLVNETDETFRLNLSAVQNATLTDLDGGAVATIFNDDPLPGLSVNDVVVVEGNAGVSPAVFTISLGVVSGQPVTVIYATSDGTATAPSDYTAQSGTLTFAPGVATQTVSINVQGDTIFETNETFFLNLSNPSGAVLVDGQGQGTITNDDAAPGLSINDVQVIEGNAGTTSATFTVSLSLVSSQPVTVRFATADGTASAAGGDYDATSGTLTFAPGVTTQTASVTVRGDVIDEPNETFTVNLSNPTNAAIVDGVGAGTIVDDDGPPSLSVSDATVLEPAAGTANAIFTVSLQPQSAQVVTVRFATSNGSAVAPADFTAQNGTLTFQPGETSKVVPVFVNADTLIEGPETFFLNLANATNATIVDGQGTGTIVDEDTAPVLSVDDVTIGEPNSGSVNAIFTVTLTGASNQQVSVGFATAGGTATADADFTSVSGNLTFNPGETTRTISVPILGDTQVEGNETFTVNLSSPSNATIADAQGVGTIVDNDGAGLAINDVSVVEGDSGFTTAIFTVSLPAQQQTVIVQFATADGTATGGVDYTPRSGTLTFAPGATSLTIAVPVVGDVNIEPDETFLVVLSNAQGSTIADSQGVGTILNDDPATADTVRIRLEADDLAGNPVSLLNIGDNFVLKAFVKDLRPGGQGVFAAYLDVLFNSPSVVVTGPLTFSTTYGNFRAGSFDSTGLNEGGATDGITPLGAAEQLLFAFPLQAVATGVAVFDADPADLIPLHGVLVYGQDGLVDPAQIDYVDTQVQVGSNILSVGDLSITEGDSGTKTGFVTVTRSLPDNTTATVVFTSAPGTATANVDYIPPSPATLTFAPGVTQQTIAVTIVGDTLNEADETFSITLSNAINATIGDGQGTVTIVNDDGAPLISISDAAADEGANLVFSVTMSKVSGQVIRVPFTTADALAGNKATADVDYTSQLGTLTFAPGVTQQTISVASLQDILTEPDEVFRVLLGNPNAGLIADGEGIGTIHNAIPAGVSGFVYVDANNNGLKDAGEIGIENVMITVTSGGTVVQSRVTAADGSYIFILPAGTYTVIETQPGFFIDGKDTPGTPPPSGPPANDRFNDIVLGTNVSAVNYNFGELGLRPEFAGVYFDRRALLASSIITGEIGPPAGTQYVDLTQGDIWLSFDNGWAGTRVFRALFVSGLGNVGLTLYDKDLRVLTTASSTTSPLQIQYRGTPNTLYFLKMSGTAQDASLQILETLSVADVTVNEGDAGTLDATVTVTLSNPTTKQVTVEYSTADGTAIAAEDYQQRAGTLTFAPGQTTQTLAVPIIGDLTDEIFENFVVNLANAVNAAIVDPQAVVTIADNDPLPALSIGDASVTEGNAGKVQMQFTVTLAQASTKTVTVQYETKNGTAVAPTDYISQTGTLTFAPLELTKTITVLVNGDTLLEPDDTFLVNLKAPVNAVLGDGSATGTIINDDGQAFSGAVPDAGAAGSGGADAGTGLPPAGGSAGGDSAAAAAGSDAPIDSPVPRAATGSTPRRPTRSIFSDEQDWLTDLALGL